MNLKSKLKNVMISKHFQIIIISIAIILYFANTLIFTFDTLWYFKYTEYFDGIIPFSQWNPVRGFTFPLILWLSRKISPGQVGITLIFFINYFIFVLYTFKLFNILQKYKLFKNHIIVVVVGLLIIFNPIIWAYYHIVLTECISMTFLIVYIYYSVNFFIYRMKCSEEKQKIGWHPIFKYALLSAVFIILLYYLKQNFIANIIFIMIPFELLFIFKDRKLKNIFLSLGILIFTIFSLFFSMNIWNKVIVADKQPSNSGFTDYIAYMRYFQPDSRTIYGDLNISVKNDNYEEIDSFKYTFSAGISNKIQYWLKCISKYPERVWTGYFDNYMLLCNLYQNERKSDAVEYIWGEVKKDDLIETITGQGQFTNIADEHRSLAISNLIHSFDAEKQIADNRNYLKELGTDSYCLDDYTFKNKSGSILVRLMVNAGVLNLYFFIYALIMFCSPFVCVYYAVLSCKYRRNIEKYIIYGINFCLSFYAFFFIFIHAFLGMAINRYVITAYLAMLIIFAEILMGLLKKIILMIKKVYFKFGKQQGYKEENANENTNYYSGL